MEFSWQFGTLEPDKNALIRKKVFVEEQGFDEALEFDSLDASSYHMLVSIEGQPIATARLYETERAGVFQIGRICVLKEHRKGGIGLQMLCEAEKKARSHGAKELILGAQHQAMGFYEKAGYIAYGESYMDEHCPHRMMRKLLNGKQHLMADNECCK